MALEQGDVLSGRVWLDIGESIYLPLVFIVLTSLVAVIAGKRSALDCSTDDTILGAISLLE